MRSRESRNTRAQCLQVGTGFDRVDAGVLPEGVELFAVLPQQQGSSWELGMTTEDSEFLHKAEFVNVLAFWDLFCHSPSPPSPKGAQIPILIREIWAMYGSNCPGRQFLSCLQRTLPTSNHVGCGSSPHFGSICSSIKQLRVSVE